MKHPTVLIVAEQPALARDIVSRWQAERTVPSFTLLSADFPRVDGLGSFDLAILQSVNGKAQPWQHSVEAMADSVLHIGSRPESLNGKGVFIPQSGDWLSTAILLGNELLRRAELIKKLKRLEGSVTHSERNASLGQYMLDSRHAFNNALTSVLGNAELLMLGVDKLGPEAREQVETIHAMALKLYEMMQRFSSLEAEMRFDENTAARETARERSAAFGS